MTIVKTANDKIFRRRLYIISYLSKGFSYNEIASLLHIRVQQVRDDIHWILIANGFKSSAQLVAVAMRIGIIQ